MLESSSSKKVISNSILETYFNNNNSNNHYQNEINNTTDIYNHNNCIADYCFANSFQSIPKDEDLDVCSREITSQFNYKFQSDKECLVVFNNLVQDSFDDYRDAHGSNKKATSTKRINHEFNQFLSAVSNVLEGSTFTAIHRLKENNYAKEIFRDIKDILASSTPSSTPSYTSTSNSNSTTTSTSNSTSNSPKKKKNRQITNYINNNYSST